MMEHSVKFAVIRLRGRVMQFRPWRTESRGRNVKCVYISVRADEKNNTESFFM